MHDAPGVNCGCGTTDADRDRTDRSSDADRSDDESADRDSRDRCEDCGTPLEWTLDLDGVQRRVCPNC